MKAGRLNGETDLPTLQAGAQAPPRISRAHGDQERSQGARPAAREVPQAPVGVARRNRNGITGAAATLKQPTLGRLTKRAEFLAAAKAAKRAAPGCVVQRRARSDGSAVIRLGFTATKKIGGAVARNRAKRRLREAARLLTLQYGAPGCDYVFIARAETLSRPWAALLDDVKAALVSLAPAASDPADGPASPGS